MDLRNGVAAEQHRRHAGAAPLPSPLETTAAVAGGSRDARALELKKVGAAQALSAQTVTTTTVTTTTVTTYPPLRLPRVRQHKVLAPEMYPLAAAPAPPALERFAVDINGQNLYFSQRGFGGYQTGEEILASIAANNAVADNAAPTARQPVAASAAFVPPEHLQRAMTPLYTQDDEDAAMAAAAAAAAVGGEPSPLLEQFAYTAPVRHAPRPELPAAAARLALGSRSRRSSSPPSPTHHRQFGRCSPSPTAARRRQLLDTAPGSTSGSSSADEHSDDDFAVASQGPATAVAAVDAINTADDAAVLPLPSPLLSPRARPEPMDTDDALDRPGAQTTTTTHTDVTHGHMSRAMAAVYDMPDMVAAYDSLPPTMQTYLLYQLLRRTPRPALQFAAQAVVPVLQRDFLGELPVEVAHHVLRFMGTRELSRAACVSRAWRRVADGDRAVWRARLVDARYVPEAARVHPLCHTYFGLGPDEPLRPITAPRPITAELDLAQLAPRPDAPTELVARAARSLLAADLPTATAGDGAAPRNAFKAAFARAYRLDRNWQTGRCRQTSFACDGGAVVTCVQLTDKYIIAGFDTKYIFVFDIHTGATVRRLEGHEGGVWALSVVGTTVVSGSTDRTVRVWDLETGRCTHVFAGHSSTVRCLQLLLPTDVRTPDERARGMPVRYEPREPLIVTGSRDTTLRVWRLPSPTRDPPYAPRPEQPQQQPLPRAAPIPATPVPRAVPADDASHMVVDQGPEYADSSSTRAQRVRRPRSQPPVAEAEGDDDGRRGTRVNPYLVRPLAGHTDSVRAVAGHGNIVVSGSYDCTIRVWNAETGECVHRLEGHTSKVYTIVLDPDHHAIFSGSMDGMIRVWNWDTGVCLRILRGHLTLVGLLSLRHGTLVSAGADTTLRVWDHPLRAPAGQPTVQQRPLSNISGDMVPFQPQPVGAVNVLTNHALAAVAHQAAGNLQQLHLLQQLQLQHRNNEQLQRQHQQMLLQQQPAGAAAGGAHDLTDLVRTERFMLNQHTNAITCFQHDGTKVVSGADTTLKLWDVRTGRFVRDLLSNLSSVWQARFDPQRCVAAVSRTDVTYFELMDFS